MKKLFHEAPNSLFFYVQALTEGDYCLVHLLEENSTYRELFTGACREREVILDNSIFELGEAFDMHKFHKWAYELKPTWYIIPDALEDTEKTLLNARTWNSVYKEATPGKTIGVVQGKDYYEIVNCYTELDRDVNVDMIAISFDYSYYEQLVPHPNKLVSWMLGRITLLGLLEKDSIINKSKPHHLLGTSLPVEGKYYRQYPWIYSVDTSNPVVAAILDIPYEQNYGLYHKESQKLFELITHPAEKVDLGLLHYNLSEFRKYWNG